MRSLTTYVLEGWEADVLELDQDASAGSESRMNDKLTINPANRLLQSPGFHDGHLTGLLVEGSTATVFLKTLQNEHYRLDLLEVDRMIANEFREGNIVSHVEIITGSEPDASYLQDLFGEPHPSVAPTYLQQHRDSVARQADRVRKGEAVIVVIVSSYGCDLTALCTDVALYPLADNGNLGAA